MNTFIHVAVVDWVYSLPIVEGFVLLNLLLLAEFVWIYAHLGQLLLVAEEHRTALVHRLFGLFYNWISEQTHVVKWKHSGYFWIVDIGCARLLLFLSFSFRLFRLRGWTFSCWSRHACLLLNRRLAFFEKQLCILELQLLLVLSDAILEAIYQLFRLIIIHELLYLLILHFSHQLDIIAFLPYRRQLFLEEPHTVLLLDISAVHMICFLYEMNEGLWLHESFSEFFLVLRFCILFEIKDLVSSCLWLCGFLVFCRFSLFRDWGFVAIFWIRFVKVFKIVDQIKEKIEKQLFYSESKFALLDLLLLLVYWIIFVQTLICGDVFLYLIHFVDIIFKFLDHERYIRLWFWWERLLKLYGLWMQVKYDEVLIHPIPSTCVYFRPQLLRYPNNEWKWSIKIINKRRRQISKHRTSPTQRKKQNQHSLKYDSIHSNIIVDNYNFPLMNYTYKNFNKKLRFDLQEEIIEIKVF